MVVMHDLGDRVDPVRLQVLDDVEAREIAAVVGRDEGLELAQRLVAEIVAIDQEQDAPGAGVLDQPVAEVAGGEGLAAAGRHLDQRARVVGGERALQVLDRLDLAVAQARGDQRRHLLQAARGACGPWASHSASVSGLWKANTGRERGFGSRRSRNRVSIPVLS